MSSGLYWQVKRVISVARARCCERATKRPSVQGWGWIKGSHSNLAAARQVELLEMPFTVITMAEVNIVNLERVGFNLRNFDMTVVFKARAPPAARAPSGRRGRRPAPLRPHAPAGLPRAHLVWRAAQAACMTGGILDSMHAGVVVRGYMCLEPGACPAQAPTAAGRTHAQGIS